MKTLKYILYVNIGLLGLALTGCSQNQAPPICANTQTTNCVQNADALNKLGYNYSHSIGVTENLTKHFNIIKKQQI